ncbi:hypothetical protein B7494_g8318 [Chlorociboria aeruginascens]|nr:hypothetical protein B7494_g8318 [Chlorociboria aeruginascens]
MRFFAQSILLVAVCGFATAIPYSEYILAPTSRTLHPVSVYQVNGSVTSPETLTSPTGSATFNGMSAVTYDYGKNIAGVVSITVGTSSSSDAFIGLTYSESSLWISGAASDATSDSGLDEILWLAVGQGPGTYAVDRSHERGGFKYLSLISNTTASIEVTSVSTNFTAVPVNDPTAYTGYFHSNDEKLNRVWYAGAYTNQLCTIDSEWGNSLVDLGDPAPAHFWYSNSTISNGSSALVDGAKRDRNVWPGDMSISFPGIFASTNDLVSVKNSLDSLLVLQAANGMLPYVGVPFFSIINEISFTYHLYSLIGMSYYYHYSGDLQYIQDNWDHFTKGLAWSLSYIDDSGLMDVTSPADWLRVGMGGHNIEANAILYFTLNQGLNLAALVNDTNSIDTWQPIAETLKSAVNNLLWDSTAGLYKDNETTILYPQDGNSWAIKSNLTDSSNKTASISNALKARWGPYGAPAPEAGAILTVSPFISSFEIEAHLLALAPQNAIDLIRLQWADFMLDDPRMTNSTFIEGYSADGSLHYAPYSLDQRVSFAHGWSTGPTSVLSFYVAGLQLVDAGGSVWKINPQVGDLTSVEAGFETNLGSFTDSVTVGDDGVISGLNFTTPTGTTGSVSLPGVAGRLISSDGTSVNLVNGDADGLAGGSWSLQMLIGFLAIRLVLEGRVMNFKFILGFLFALFQITPINGYDADICCNLAKSRQAFLSPVPAESNQTCGQTFQQGLAPATPLYVSYRFCAANCGGIGLAKANDPNAWAMPVINFILPAVIFSMTIPRRKLVDYNYLFDFEQLHNRSFLQLLVSLFLFILILFPIIIDTLVWIFVIVSGAGNMLVGALYEAHLDYRIVKYIKEGDLDESTLDRRRELLVTIACGNLMLETGNPQVSIPKSLMMTATPDADAREKSRSRLLNLLGAQAGFGSTCGSPVLFYLGAFVYTILDLQSNPSSEDSAESLGFGIEWMIIVHVAIVSSCLLASNNPSTSAGIVGTGHEALEPPRRLVPAAPLGSYMEGVGQRKKPWTWERFSQTILGWSDAYETEFQPVSLWSRGTNKMKWIRRSRAWREDPEFRALMEITWMGWFFKIFIPALLLHVLPPGAGGIVAYFTPPRGLGCRSLSFMIYAFCQITVTIFSLLTNATENTPGLAQRIFHGRAFRLLSIFFWLVSFFAAVGGTIMQISGVYNNCICSGGATSWYNINQVNPSINLASDTASARAASVYWTIMGATATIFMALNCYIGWWYQRLIRKRFTEAVKDIVSDTEAPLLRPEFQMRPDDSWVRVSDPEKSAFSGIVLDPVRLSEPKNWDMERQAGWDRDRDRSRSPSLRYGHARPSSTSSQTPILVFGNEAGRGEVGLALASPRRPRPRSDS